MRTYVVTLIALCAVCFAAPGHASVLYVNKNASGAVHDGRSWATAFTTVGEGMHAALKGDEVWVAASIPAAPAYEEEVHLRDGVVLYGGFAGTETARGQRDPKSHPTILDGREWFSPVVASYVLGSCVIDGFTIRNAGAGVATGGESTTVINCTFTGCGFGIWVYTTTRLGTTTVTNCTLSGNGEAVHVVGDPTQITNCTITGNMSGIWVGAGSTASVTNSIVAFNQSGVSQADATSQVSLSHNDVFGNAGGNYVNGTDPTGIDGNQSQDPRLSSLYHDVHLQPLSPCIDAGLDSALGPGWTDIDGQPRVQGGTVDIGSDESDGTLWNVAARVWFVSPAGDDARDGSSWEAAKRTVAGTLAAAQGVDELWVAAGTYLENVSIPPGVALYGGFAGTETARSQRDWTANPTILDGSGNPNAAAVTFVYQGATLDGFLVRGGSVSVNGGSAAIRHCHLTGNRAGVSVSSGVAAVADCTVTNTAAGVSVNGGTATVTNCTLTANVGSGVQVSGGSARVVNCLIAFNGKGVSRTDAAFPVTLSHNDVFGNVIADYDRVTDPTGTDGNLRVDPLLSNAYHDVHIQPGSPCIDSGDDGAVMADDLDAYGKPRLLGAHVDIGSDESDGTAWNVPRRTWFVSPSGSDASDGLSWATSKKTVEAALAVAQGTDEVWVGKGTYDATLVLSGIALYGGFAGTETSRDQRNWTANPTVLDGGNQLRTVVTCNGLNAVVDGFVLHNGPSGSIQHLGIGVAASIGTTVANCTITGFSMGTAAYGAAVTLSNCIVSGNDQGVGAAGGLAPDYARPQIVVTGGQFSGNRYGIYQTGGTTSITGTAFQANTARGISVDLNPGGSVSITGCAFTGPGGLTVSSSSPDGVGGRATVKDCTFSGGGVDGVNVGSLVNSTVTGCSFSGGAGLGFGGPGTATNCTLRGGGVSVGYGGAVTIANCLITGSSSSGVSVDGGPATITNCTITGHSQYGIHVLSGTATVTNCIVAFNRTGVHRYDSSRTATLSHCDVFGNPGGDYSNMPDQTGSNGNLRLDPRLSNPYHDIHLEPDSPCVDAGVDSVVRSGWTDINGRPRIIGAHVDIGAEESDGTVYTVPSRTWYVTSRGDDANDGTSWSNAKKTVGAALGTAQGTDEVWVAAGAYAERVAIPIGVALYGGFAGTETNRAGRDWRANPTVLDGGGQGNVVYSPVVGAVVDGLTIRNGAYGIYAAGGTTTIANCAFTGNAPSAGVGLLIGAATITDCTFDGNARGVSSSSGLTTVLDCAFRNNTVDGIDASGGTLQVAGCLISGSPSGASIGYLTSCAVHDCLLSANRTGIALSSGKASITNCTVVGSTTAGIASTSNGAPTVTNCIVANNKTGLSRQLSSIPFAVSHSDIYGNTTNYGNLPDATGTNGNIAADPLFVDSAADDYHLRAGSPCIDSGDDAALILGQTDLDGHPRRIGPHVDMGAYEFGSAYFTFTDVAKALSIAGGLTTASATDAARLHVTGAGTPGAVTLHDAAALARQAAPGPNS